MKVLQHGKHWVAPEYPKRKRCDCGCVFLYNRDEIITDIIGDKIICPECGRSFRLESKQEPVRYIEGYAYCMFPIEHAFVKYGDRYIDATYERACHLDVRKELYTSLIELEPDTLRRYLLDTGYYGNLYQYDYWLKNDSIRAAAVRAMNK